MIDSLIGEVVRIGSDFVVIDTGGVAYHCAATTTALRELSVGHEALVYTQLIVRDDSMQLYGFASLDEREVFRQLLTVGQVGPKLALQILSAVPVDELVVAVSTSDVVRLTQIKGVGVKTAERILVDLRDKLGSTGTKAPGEFLLSTAEETALRALTTRLGFSPREAREAVQRLHGRGLSAEAIIRGALEYLGSQG